MKNGLIIGIDASNIKAGGGITHLKGLLEHANPIEFGIEKVIIWGGKQLNLLADREWLVKDIQEDLNGSYFCETYWKVFRLTRLASENCDLLFCPGTNKPRSYMPYVSMSQNMLVFEDLERSRFPWSWTRLRYHILEVIQTASLRGARGNIFISDYAKNYVTRKKKQLRNIPSTVVYHGCFPMFRLAPRVSKPIETYHSDKPFKILYVSIINFYKHQWNVIEGLDRLHREGYPIELHLVGPAKKDALPLLEKAMNKAGSFVKYHGEVQYVKIAEFYKDSDMFLFGSTCENMPNILIESMYAGLPIMSSNYGPMPEILEDGGVYFDPLNPDDIYLKAKKLLDDQKLRNEIAEISFQNSKKYTWDRCAQETFKFLSEIARNKI